MKIVFWLVLLVLSFTVLNSTIFIDMYHKDYGVIDRSVLVFSDKPAYKIIQNENDIQLNISNCTKDINIQNQQFPNSAVIQSFDFYSTEDKVMIVISINTSRQLQTGYHYSLEKQEIDDEVFKLILDVYSTKTPKTYAEYASFAFFFEATGKHATAQPYREMANRLKAQMPAEEITQTEREVSLQQQQIRQSQFMYSLSEFFTISRIILLIIGIILIAAIIFTISYMLRSRKGAKLIKGISSRVKNGFGSEDFRRAVIKKLEEHFWGAEEIAMELEISTNEVYRATAPEFAEELEKTK
jgi:hypothetical protein